MEGLVASGQRATRWLERGLIVAGGALLAFWLLARLDGAAGRRAALARFEALRATPAPALPALPAPADMPAPLPEPVQVFRAAPLALPAMVDQHLWSHKRVCAYDAIRSLRFSDPMAVLRIPSAGIEVPVLPGTDDVTLNRAVGWIEGTARPGELGNAGIAGHRDGFFRGLKDSALGDRISLETLEGPKEYVIDQIRIVSPNDVGVLAPTKDSTLTLVTCYPFYFVGDAPQRYIVRAQVRPDLSTVTASR